MDTPDGIVVARRVRVPASSANLGPGFDTLGIAWQCYTEVTVEPADAFSMTAEGEGASYVGRNHVVARFLRGKFGHERFRLHVRSEVPMTRGMGSSAAIHAAAAAAGGVADPFAYTAELEGHADNAAAATMGGLVTGAMVDGRAVAAKLPLDPSLRFVLVIPDRHLRTADARRVLPRSLPRADVVQQLGRFGQLIAGLADHRLLEPHCTEDWVHQRQRTKLFPESTQIIGSMVSSGALAACWSGAGPTLLAMCNEQTLDAVLGAAGRAVKDLGVEATVRPIEVDLQGLLIEE
jgi:homoserine kinase